ncbi:hypothetical protein V9T40_003152 [Parthenolecanium corni]|uniref:Sorting nexin-17 n=1 Tax=Parthenolecanium corni TaxID=536013 RepID=A0AAN9Y7R1_9HEMI
MNFSIPDSKEVKDATGASFVVYSIYVNGIFHCDARYSQLYTLNENLKQVHGSHKLPFFPPKRFFSLTKAQSEERQYCLEKYLQNVSQNTELVHSSVLRRFLFAAQQKSASDQHFNNDLSIWLLNGTQVLVKASSEDSSENVLQKVCDQLRVPQELVQYFSLFVMSTIESGSSQLIHCLQDYECPLITLKHLSGQNKIIIRKSYWDPAIDLKLMSDRFTLNLLYGQTLSDIERGWVIADVDTEQQLATLQSRGAKREYLEIARSLKYYGYLRFDGCTCDYPEPGTDTIISIGHKELIFTLKSADSADNESRFRITRIRCWKITPLSEFNKEVQLSFEYLVSADKLQWITVISQSVFFISVCLQATVDELMMKKNGSLTNNMKKLRIVDGAKESSSKSKSSLLHFTPLLENDSFENIGDEDL